MAAVGVIVAFGSVIYLASKGIDLWLALLVGTGALGLLSLMESGPLAAAVIDGLFGAATIQLVVAVALISGLGRAMKESGDFDRMVSSLVALIPKPKVLMMLLPAIIGTINVPGGAIMSAPMVEEHGTALNLDRTTLASVNLFFRHIGYFIYPLQTSLIIISELLDIPKHSIILYNAAPALVGAAAAYLFFFGNHNTGSALQKNPRDIAYQFTEFLLGFSPVMVIIALMLLFDAPFYLAAASGLCLALVRNIQAEHWGAALLSRLQQLFSGWINYELVLAVLSLMVFRAVV